MPPMRDTMTSRHSTFENVIINLEHDIDEQYQYQPGEIIRGKISILLHRSTVVQSVYISIQGEGLCSWDDDYDGTMQSNENYVKATKIIFDSSEKPRMIDQGHHDFPFEYQLPENIPSSFIGKYGSITYILKAVINGDKPGSNIITTEPFLVMRMAELPEDLSEPVEQQIAKRFFSMCSWGKMKARVRVNKTGFVPGDEINIEAEVQNKSPVRITAIQASLIMISGYHAQKNMVSHRQIVNKRRDDYELIEGDGRRWQSVKIPIPPYIPESALTCCDIIDLSYIFQFRVELSGGGEVKLEFPITIGAHPKGLEVPSKQDNNPNIHWATGPKDYANHTDVLNEDEDDVHDKWRVEAPEFRQENEKVVNPLYRNDSLKHQKEDKQSKQSDRYHDFEFDFSPADPRHNTKL